MSPDLSSANIRKFCMLLFSITALTGISLFLIVGKTVLGGVGLSAGIISVISLFHFFVKKSQNSNWVEDGISAYLLLGCLIGVLMIFITKSKNGSEFLMGTGGGIALACGFTYVLEMLHNFLDGIK